VSEEQEPQEHPEDPLPGVLAELDQWKEQVHMVAELYAITFAAMKKRELGNEEAIRFTIAAVKGVGGEE